MVSSRALTLIIAFKIRRKARAWVILFRSMHEGDEEHGQTPCSESNDQPVLGPSIEKQNRQRQLNYANGQLERNVATKFLRIYNSGPQAPAHHQTLR